MCCFGSRLCNYADHYRLIQDHTRPSAFYQAVRELVNIFTHRVLRAAMFSGPHASRILLTTPKAFASRRLPLSARNQNQMAKFMESDACASDYSRGLGPWWRSRARPRCQMGSRSGRLSGVGEGAVETLEREPGEEARDSASGDIHRVLPRYYRRGIEVESYIRSTTTEDAVRRDSINREVARLETGRIHWSAHENDKIRQLSKDSAVTGRLGRHH